MDMKHAFPAPELRKVGVLQSSDTVHLVLIHGDSSIHLRLFTDAEETELLEIINTDLDRVYQFDTFLTESQWCILLAGSNSSYIYCLQGTDAIPLNSLNHSVLYIIFSSTPMYPCRGKTITVANSAAQ